MVARLAAAAFFAALFISTSEAELGFVPLREAARGIARLRIGAAGPASLLANASSAYAKTLARNYDLTTAENACKWGATEAIKGQFSFEKCDVVRDFAHAHNMSFRGHNLCWGIHNPDWLKTLSPSEKRSALIAHITAVVGHYGTDAVAWDVVNEAISDGSCQDDDNPWCLKASDWFPDVPDFVFVAFETARKVAPSGVKLFYNDYSIANAHCTKAKRVYALVQNLTSRGLIDGIGLQMRPEGWELKNDNGAGLTKTFAQYDALGIDVHITEMDVKNPDPADDAAQASVHCCRRGVHRLRIVHQL